MEVSKGWGQSTWSSLSAPPVWASTRRCMGSLEASRYSVELNTNMGSGSCLVPGKGSRSFLLLGPFQAGKQEMGDGVLLGRDEGEGEPTLSWGQTSAPGSGNIYHSPTPCPPPRVTLRAVALSSLWSSGVYSGKLLTATLGESSRELLLGGCSTDRHVPLSQAALFRSVSHQQQLCPHLERLF